MGLDMYANWTSVQIGAFVDFDEPEDVEQFFYWRKHSDLHGWMKALYKKQGGEEDEFNLSTLQLTKEDLDKLEEDVEADTLPSTTGFFFGESGELDKFKDRDFIKEARKLLAEGKTIYYLAWW